MEFHSIIPAIVSKADVGAAGMTVNPERAEEVNFSDSIRNRRSGYIVRKIQIIMGI